MKTKMLIALFAALFTFVWSEAALSRTRAPERDRAGADRTEGDIVLKRNAHVMKYVPSDLRGVRQAAPTGCDGAGLPAKSTRENGYSGRLTYTSASTDTKWVICYVQPGTAERVFQEKDGNLSLHVRFDPKHISGTLYVSSDASRYAEANGIQSNPGVEKAKGGNAVPSAQAKDCSKISDFLKKAQCMATNQAESISTGITK